MPAETLCALHQIDRCSKCFPGSFPRRGDDSAAAARAVADEAAATVAGQVHPGQRAAGLIPWDPAAA